MKQLLIFSSYCSIIFEERATILSEISETNSYILTCTDTKVVQTFLLTTLYFINLMVMGFLMLQSIYSFIETI